VNGLDAFGLDPDQAGAIEQLATENVKRVARPPSRGVDAYDWLAASAQSPYLIGQFVETKTVWHPIGA